MTVGVRFAKEEETLTTLDDKERKLEAETLLITANDRPVALAGVMGGATTEVEDDTQSVFLGSSLL